jgi:hypothetical protein
MGYLVIDLKQKLIHRKMNEMKLIENLDKEADKNLILVASGKIFELDFLIKSLDEMIEYLYKTKKIYH